MGAVHLLPWDHLSNVMDKGDYPSEKTAVLTMAELDSWIALQIAGVYHQSVHSALHRPPIQAWSAMMEHRSRPLKHPASPEQFFLDFLPGERRMIRRDGIRLFNIYYWDNYLSPLAGRSQDTMMIKYDPRNLSRVFLQDDEGRYWPIPYRDLGLPPISLWEHWEAMKRLKQEGRQAVEERTIFDTILKQRKLIESARRTTRQRRMLERGRPRADAVNTPSVSAEAEGAELSPFKVEEW